MHRNTLLTDKIDAMRSGDKLRVKLLGFILGEIDRAKNPDSVDIVKMIQKVRANLLETIEYQDSADSRKELAILDGYLPSQLSSAELSAALESISLDVLEQDNIGEGIKFAYSRLEELHPSFLFNKKEVGKFVQNIFKGK